MAKVTSKLQVTVPKSLAVQYGIRPGDEIRFEEAGEVIRLVPPNGPAAESLDVEARLADAATERQRAREPSGDGVRSIRRLDPGRAIRWPRGH